MGQIVGHFIDFVSGNSNYHYQGFFLNSAGNFSLIEVPGATSTEAHGINDMGQIVGSFCNAPDCQAISPQPGWIVSGYLDTGGSSLLGPG
jgi:hypothetical protein